MANVKSKAELLDYLRRRERQGEGYAALGELADAYPAARQDLEVRGQFIKQWGVHAQQWLGSAATTLESRVWGLGAARAARRPPAVPLPLATPSQRCPPPAPAPEPATTAPRAQALKKEGLIISLPAADATRKEVFYPVDQRMRLRVDQDLQVGPQGGAYQGAQPRFSCCWTGPRRAQQSVSWRACGQAITPVLVTRVSPPLPPPVSLPRRSCGCPWGR